MPRSPRFRRPARSPPRLATHARSRHHRVSLSLTAARGGLRGARHSPHGRAAALDAAAPPVAPGAPRGVPRSLRARARLPQPAGAAARACAAAAHVGARHRRAAAQGAREGARRRAGRELAREIDDASLPLSPCCGSACTTATHAALTLVAATLAPRRTRMPPPRSSRPCPRPPSAARMRSRSRRSPPPPASRGAARSARPPRGCSCAPCCTAAAWQKRRSAQREPVGPCWLALVACLSAQRGR